MQTTEHKNKNTDTDTVIWKALANLVVRFKFSNSEGMVLMGDMPRSTYAKGIHQHKGKLSRDQRDRISYLLGIYKALRILFIDSEQAMSWINRANELPPFNGISPREYMLEGGIPRLEDVRRFLDYWRGY